MPISGTEVGAKLRITYESDLRLLDAELKQAKINIDKLNADMQAGGEEGAKAAGMLGPWVEKAAQFEQKIADINGQMGVLGQQTSAVENIVGRMAIRFAAMFAAKEIFDFTKSIFTSAQELVTLNDELGISIETLEVLQFGATKLEIPFTKVSQAVTTLNKNFDTMKVSSLEALNELNLSFYNLQSLDPEARFNAIITALEGIPDPTQRARLELELFGTEGIDPLVEKFDGLKKEASVDTLAAETQRNLSTTTGFWDQFWNHLKVEAAEWLDIQQRIAKTGFELMGVSGSGGIIDAIKQIKDLGIAFTLAGGDINKFFDAYNALLKTQEAHTEKQKENLTIDEELNIILQKQGGLVEELTVDQKHAMDVLQQAGLATEQNAASIGLSVAQYKEYEKSVKAADKELKDFQNTEKQDDKAAARQAEQFKKNWEDQIQLLETLTAKANEEEDKRHKAKLVLADKYNTIEEKDYLEHLKKMHDQGLISDATYANSAYAAQVQAHNRSLMLQEEEHRAELAAVDEQQKKEIAAITKKFNEGKILAKEYQDDLNEIYRDGAAKRGEIDDRYTEKAKEERITSIDLEEKRAEELAAKDKKRFDDWNKEWDDRMAKEQKEVFTQDVTFSNFDQSIAGFGFSPGSADELAKEGYSFSEIIAILRGGKKGKPIGPRIPGFVSGTENFAGGTALVGEQGPELVNLPSGSSITPLSKAGGISIINHFHGTPESMLHQANERLMTTLRTYRQWPAAGQR
jgi:hypothetical protein